MANMSVRGLDDKLLAQLKHQAQREGSSLNSLVIRLLKAQTSGQQRKQPQIVFDDLDALAGTWSSAQTRTFQRDTAPFRAVDPALWK
jgi:plasmid stability protein